MKPDQLNYPATSRNVNRNKSNFWVNMGLGVRHQNNLNSVSDTLLRAPVAKYNRDSYKVESDFGFDGKGKITLMAAQKILGQEILDGEDLIVRMLEHNSNPEVEKTFDTHLKVEKIPEEYRTNINPGYADPIMMQQVPDQMEIGKEYDFTVIHYGSDEFILSDSNTQVSPQNWR